MKRRKKISWIGVCLLFLLLMAGCSFLYSGKNADREKKLSSIQMLIDQYYLKDTKETEFEEGIYKGYVEQLEDPYSVYYTKEEYDELMEDDSGQYVGIGVVISQNIKTKEVMITRIFDGGPAERAGLKRYDIISEIEGESVANMELSDVVKKIKKGENDTIMMTVYRDAEKMEVQVDREDVEAQMVESCMLKNEIGYIAIYEFIENTYDQFHERLEDLKKQGMKGLILDLRSNPGGLLDQVKKVADDFIPEGSVIVSTEDKQGNKEYLKAETEEEFDFPMVVLVDGYSASASEILAGAIKDYGIGMLIGQTTFGKGIVQRIFPLPDGSAVKLTISKYYTPSGNYIHEKGIEPDVPMEEVYVEEKGDTLEDDTWIKQAQKELKKQIGE